MVAKKDYFVLVSNVDGAIAVSSVPFSPKADLRYCRSV